VIQRPCTHDSRWNFYQGPFTIVTRASNMKTFATFYATTLGTHIKPT
jgi:hypothetical protein